MIYFFVFLAILTFFIIVSFRKRDDKIIAQIRLNWGREIDRYRDIKRIERYADFKKSEGVYHLSDQTLKDVDMESLFPFLDRTITGIGQQYLYKKLLFPEKPEELKESDKLVNYFNSEPAKREDVQKILYRLETYGTYRMVDFFTMKNPEKNKDAVLHKWLTIATIAGVIGTIFFPIILIYLIPIVAINLSISFIFKYRNEKKLNAVKEVYGLLKTCRKLQKLDININKTAILSSISAFKSFEKRYRYLNLGIPDDDLSKTLFYMIEMVKSIFLMDLHLLNSSYQKVLSNLESLENLYQYVGELDTVISIASLKNDRFAKWCTPTLTNEKRVLKFTNAIHPLIENCVPNSINLQNKSAFITGSNMSGKSTFLRTILINELLAQTLYICFADDFTTTLMQPFSSITIDDDLMEGSSYFFMEVATIKKMTDQIPSGINNLFVIDEVFKGTNTVERISLAKAILNYLNNSDNIVIASSHDLELIELLSDKFEMFYFSETIKDDILYFDHAIKHGSLKTTNAIKIVELENFPKSIVDEAYQMAGEFKRESFR